MRTLIATVVGMVTVPAGIVAGAETPVESRVDSVGLFKNGMAVVRRVTTVPGPGVYTVSDVPEPVHGTFWIESDAVVETRITSRTVEVPATRGGGLDFQEALAGRSVTIFFREGQIPPATGVVEELQAGTGSEAWSRSYERSVYDRYYAGPTAAPQPGAGGRFLVLRTAKGRSFVDAGMIAYLQADGAGDTIRRQAPVLIFTVEKVTKTPATIVMTYLTKGMSWAPAYRVDVTDPERLTIEQEAVIRNEMGAVDGAEVQLISGFPNVKFGHVVSPLSTRTSWAEFFRQISMRLETGHVSLSNVVTQQQIGPRDNSAVERALAAVPTGDGVDVYYHSIGRRSLAEGDAMCLTVASAQVAYDRIVEWIVPDTRDEYGRHIEEYQRRQNPEKYEDAAWDAVRFKNPFPFPMTTAAAMIVAKGRFSGQQLSYWVNPGEETVLRINKALSLRTRAVEREVQNAGDDTGRREIVYIGGRSFRKVQVEGELAVANYRNERLRVLVRRCFSGELIKGDESPKVVLREEGVYSVNQRSELTWDLSLEPGAAKTLTYRYYVLVHH